MTEQLNLTPEYDGTRFDDGTVIDMHVARDGLDTIENARIAWRQAEMQREQAQRDAELAATREARRTNEIMARVTWYRGEKLRMENPEDYGLAA